MKKIIYLIAALLLTAACNNTVTPTEQSPVESTEASVPEGTIEIAIIDVTGMHCEACENTIAGVLTALDGVESARVSLEYEQAKVKFYPSKVSTDDFIAAIENKGYGVGNVEIVKMEDQAKEGNE